LINRILFYFFYWIFRVLAFFFPAIPNVLNKKGLKRILVFSAAGIGDTLTDSVAIHALKRSFPAAKIMVVTHRRRAVIALHNPFIDEVILYHKSALYFLTLVRSLRKRSPEVIVMLRGNDPDLWPLAYLVNRHSIISCPRMTRFKFLISHPVEIEKWEHLHGVEQTLEIVRVLGAEVKDRTLVYQVLDEERRSIADRFLSLGLQNKPFIIFQVGGGRRSSWRDWPVFHYASLGKLLIERYDTQIVLLGGRDLDDKGKEIQNALPQAINLVGKLSLSESAALLSLATILVSTDTGIMHLGFAVGVDTLALIHCNNPASRVGPYGYGEKHPVIQLAPPVGVPVSKNIEMTRISPDDAWSRLQSLCAHHCIPERKKDCLSSLPQ
jgi:ADP-heptose:LPS heptosyltransferase